MYIIFKQIALVELFREDKELLFNARTGIVGHSESFVVLHNYCRELPIDDYEGICLKKLSFKCGVM